MAAQGVQLPNNVPYVQAMNLNRANPTTGHNRDEEQRVAGQQEVAEVNDDDDGGLGLDRDWLESIFLILRAAVLFGIVYFYSSPLRFLVVTLLGIAIHLYAHPDYSSLQFSS